MLDAEVRLGELFAALEKSKNQYAPSTSGSSKYEVIKNLGFTDPGKTAYRFELLARHKDIIEQACRQFGRGA